MPVLSSELQCHFLTKARNLQVTEVEQYSIQIFVLEEKNLTKQKTKVRINHLFLRYCLQQMNATG